MSFSPQGGRYNAELIRSLIFSSISSTYAQIANAPTEFSARQVCFTNLTNSNLFITWGPAPESDGTDDKIILPANGFRLLDITTNLIPSDPLLLPAQTLFWARTATGSSNPSSGFVYAEVYYGY